MNSARLGHMPKESEIPPDRQRQFDFIEVAKAQALQWAQGHDVPLHEIEFTVPLVEDDFSLEVYLFYKTDREVTELSTDGTTDRLKEQFLSILRDLSYPKEWLDHVRFFVDSHETVKRDYEGSYFYRLR